MDNSEELLNSKVWLEKAYKDGKIGKKYYEDEINKVNGKLDIIHKEKSSQFVQKRLHENPSLSFNDSHFIINLTCPKCKLSGIYSFDKQDFKLLGKDTKGFIYFECVSCNAHIQWDSINGRTKTNKGILGYLFNRFS